ncbi:hypothetical protein BHUM_06415 [Candidatus Burkholderia humilis]|nr:hypothetical protein BHUM_06415 [Candidatus Burkholderia humilis]
MRILDTLSASAKRIKRDSMTLWFAYRDPRTPMLVKLLCVFVVAYALSPIDLIPDFIPVLGYLDDALLLPGLTWLAIRLLPNRSSMKAAPAPMHGWPGRAHGRGVTREPRSSSRYGWRWRTRRGRGSSTERDT